MNQHDLEREIFISLAVLGLQTSAISDRAAITSAYRRLARTVHPDVSQGPEAERLMDLGTRARDLLLKVELRRQKPPPQTVRVQWTSGYYAAPSSTSWDGNT